MECATEIAKARGISPATGVSIIGARCITAMRSSAPAAVKVASEHLRPQNVDRLRPPGVRGMQRLAFQQQRGVGVVRLFDHPFDGHRGVNDGLCQRP